MTGKRTVALEIVFELFTLLAFASSDRFKPAPILPLTAISFFPNPMDTSTTAVQPQLCEVSDALITRGYGKLRIEQWENLQRRYYAQGRDPGGLLWCARFRPSMILTTPTPSTTSRTQRATHQATVCDENAHMHPTLGVSHTVAGKP